MRDWSSLQEIFEIWELYRAGIGLTVEIGWGFRSVQLGSCFGQCFGFRGYSFLVRATSKLSLINSELKVIFFFILGSSNLLSTTGSLSSPSSSLPKVPPILPSCSRSCQTPKGTPFSILSITQNSLSLRHQAGTLPSIQASTTFLFFFFTLFCFLDSFSRIRAQTRFSMPRFWEKFVRIQDRWVSPRTRLHRQIFRVFLSPSLNSLVFPLFLILFLMVDTFTSSCNRYSETSSLVFSQGSYKFIKFSITSPQQNSWNLPSSKDSWNYNRDSRISFFMEDREPGVGFLLRARILFDFYQGFRILQALVWAWLRTECVERSFFGSSIMGFVWELFVCTFGDTCEKVFFNVLFFRFSMLETALWVVLVPLPQANDMVIRISCSFSSYFLSSLSLAVKFSRHLTSNLQTLTLIFSVSPSLTLARTSASPPSSPENAPRNIGQLPYSRATVLRKTMKLPYCTLVFLLPAPQLTACSKSTLLFVDRALQRRRESQSQQSSWFIWWVACKRNFQNRKSRGKERGRIGLLCQVRHFRIFRPFVEIIALLDYTITRIMYDRLVSWFKGKGGIGLPSLTPLKYFSNTSIKLSLNFCWSLLFFNCSNCEAFSKTSISLRLKLAGYGPFVGVFFLFLFFIALFKFYVGMFSISFLPLSKLLSSISSWAPFSSSSSYLSISSATSLTALLGCFLPISWTLASSWVMPSMLTTSRAKITHFSWAVLLSFLSRNWGYRSIFSMISANFCIISLPLFILRGNLSKPWSVSLTNSLPEHMPRSISISTQSRAAMRTPGCSSSTISQKNGISFLTVYSLPPISTPPPSPPPSLNKQSSCSYISLRTFQLLELSLTYRLPTGISYQKDAVC